jgi:uncharacterized membrane protein
VTSSGLPAATKAHEVSVLLAGAAGGGGGGGVVGVVVVVVVVLVVMLLLVLMIGVGATEEDEVAGRACSGHQPLDDRLVPQHCRHV